MGTPKDVAAEKHFTPPTLTQMLDKSLNFGGGPETKCEADATEWELTIIKDVFKDWLRTVGLTDCGSPEAIRQLLITLVDEP